MTKTLGYYATRKEAMLALAEYNSNPFDLEKLTFEEVWEKWTPKHFEKFKSSESGLKTAYNKCNQLHKMKMTDIRTAHLQAVMDAYSHQSVEAQTKIKTVFRNTFKFAMENDLIKKDYSEFVTINRTERKVKEKFFTPKEIKAILDKKDDVMTILLYTGMRINELLSLKCEDVNLEERMIHVRGTKTENADRLVPIHKELIPVLEKCMNGVYLITNSRGEKMSYHNYSSVHYKRLAEELGITQTPHATRHTFISRMDSCGVTSESVVLKRIVGHANSSVTEMYTHKTNKELIEAIDKLKLV